METLIKNCFYNYEKGIKISVTRVGDFLYFGQLLKLFATMNLPKFPTFLGNFSKGAKIIDFSNEIIFGQLL